jgi:hypothetical protein
VTLKLTDRPIDHEGNPLPSGVYATATPDGTIVGYRTRWREDDDDGVRRNASKRFSARKLGSLDRARADACAYRAAAAEIARRGELVLRPERADRMTVDELFKEWLTDHAAINLSERYATDAVGWWDREIATRPISRVRLARIADDPAIITRFQDELIRARLSGPSRVQVLKILRSVLRWGRRRYPRTLTIEISGLFTLPSQRRQRLIYAADAIGVERVIEAALARRARHPLRPIRDAAMVAAMGFTVAARPSEWLYSATWSDLYERTVELQRPAGGLAEDLERARGVVDGREEGLKTGARAALLFANARDRLLAYRSELEAHHGPQPENALVFQALGRDGPVWSDDGTPAAWTVNEYKRWAARVWRPARERAAKAPDVPRGMATMRFKTCGTRRSRWRCTRRAASALDHRGRVRRARR